ncbi:MAG: hypothetical protein JWQ98_1618 [Chlorobi bacterium]|jgi:hypothetical protein|nr:hypothetical protein [Chlorobiota bacterium]
MSFHDVPWKGFGPMAHGTGSCQENRIAIEKVAMDGISADIIAGNNAWERR